MISVENLSELGPALKELRLEVRMTQGEVCALAGVKASQLSRWENGHDKPTLESVVKILNALDCDLGDLQHILAGGSDEERNDAAYRRKQLEHLERVRGAYCDAWRARYHVARLMAEGLISIVQEPLGEADREERAALYRLLAEASQQYIERREGYFARLSVEELWAHFRALENRFPPWVTEDPDLTMPMLSLGRRAVERWGDEELRRGKTKSELAVERTAQALERLEERLAGVEGRLEDLGHQL